MSNLHTLIEAADMVENGECISSSYVLVETNTKKNIDICINKNTGTVLSVCKIIENNSENAEKYFINRCKIINIKLPSNTKFMNTSYTSEDKYSEVAINNNTIYIGIKRTILDINELERNITSLCNVLKIDGNKRYKIN